MTPSAPRSASPARWLALALVLAAILSAVEGLGIVQDRVVLVALVALSAYALAIAGAAAAAVSFGPGDHLRRAWTLVGALYLGLGIGRLCFPHDLLGLPDAPALPWVRAALTLAANACGVVGIATFAATWLRTGLPKPGTRRERWAVTLVLAAATLGLVGPDLWSSTAGALRGDIYAGALAIGDAADVVMFLLLVPIFLTARALTGGSLAWPFALLCAADLSWLMLDGLTTYGDLLGVDPVTLRVVNNAFRTTACALLATAGLTQRLAIQRAARSAGRG